VQQEQGIEKLAEVQLRQRAPWRSEGVDDVQPRSPRVVVSSQAVHRRGRVRTAAEIARTRPAGPLPSLAEPLGQADCLMPITRQHRDQEQPRGSQVALLMENGRSRRRSANLLAAGRSQLAW
jgi:hypothetical protein